MSKIYALPCMTRRVLIRKCVQNMYVAFQTCLFSLIFEVFSRNSFKNIWYVIFKFSKRIKRFGIVLKLQDGESKECGNV